MDNKKENPNLTKFNNEFSEEIYNQTYKFSDENINDTFQRIAKQLSSIESDPQKYEEIFKKLLNDFKFVPGGRIISNAGVPIRGTSMINCFVDGFLGEDQDSMESIMDALRRQALILKSEGGYGFCADVMRPRGSFIKGIGNETPGAVTMLDMWDTQSSVITAGSGNKTNRKNSKVKIRKGAQMVTLSCHHPDIEEFITSKQTPGKLTKFNMSVLVTDDFMDCVKNNKPWNLEFPDYEKHPTEYKKEWKGNLKKWKSKGYSVVVYKTYENANQLWDIIMKSTYNRNEPGVLFIDTINRFNNLRYCEFINATNPCGEQPLPIGGVCLLGSINLTQFIDFEKKDWDYEKLKNHIPNIVRMMDNVNDITYVPLEYQKENLISKRRIGMGIMGYGSAIMMLKLRYGSEKCLELTDNLMSFIANISYQSSSLLAKEKGCFEKYEESEYLKSEFINNSLSKETIDMIKKYGMRNSHLLSIQPTGNSSIFANNVSGGLEPVFMSEYIRTTIMPYAPEGLDVPKSIDWDNKTYISSTKWEFTKEGDDVILSTTFKGNTWKYDKNRGLLRETLIEDYAVKFLKERNEWDPKAEWASTTETLSIDDHINVMSVMSKYIDSAMSKTINIPNEYLYENFKDLYMKLYDTKTVKGGTTYRLGTMTSVLSNPDKKDKDKVIMGITKTEAPKRPETLECDIHQLTVSGDKWIVIIGLYGENKDPYEVFAFKKKYINLSTSIKNGHLTKIKRGRYDLEINGVVIEDIKENFEVPEEQALTRLISTALRHGADINFIYEQLQKSEGNIISFSKAIARSLKKYLNGEKISHLDCPECGSEKSLIMQEGCYICKNCGWSKCS
jgi:ribonucleoside-diphosphate reductase alpha chain